MGTIVQESYRPRQEADDAAGVEGISWFAAKEPEDQPSTAYVYGRQMSAWLIILTGAIYAYVALEQGMKGNMSMAMVYAGYAFSNIGLFLLAR